MYGINVIIFIKFRNRLKTEGRKGTVVNKGGGAGRNDLDGYR